MRDEDWEEITRDTFDDSAPSSPEALLQNLPISTLCTIIDGTYDEVFGREEIGRTDIAQVAGYLASGKIDYDHFGLFNERSRRALVGIYRLYDMYALYLVLSKEAPSSKALLERMIGHAFFGGISVATGCERTIDYVRKSIRYDDQRYKQSEAAWDTARKRTKWRDEARLLYEQVIAAEPHLKTAPKIIDRMNELKRIRGSSPAQLLSLVRQWRSEARKSGH